MKRSILKILSSSLFAIFILTGCGINKVYNVPSKTFNEKPENQTVYNAIIKAGEYLGWNMKQVDNNTIIGNLVIREHIAKIQITFDKNSYNIKLLEAQNLNYDKSNNTIHNNYNGWIRNLENQIDSKLIVLKMNEKLKIEEQLAANYKKDQMPAENNKYKPIYDVENKSINKKYENIQQISQKILNVGDKTNWVMSKQKEGFILAKVVRRVHTAIVRIDYTLDSYSIKYITSTNLGADTHYNIHNNYNIWIKELEEGIDFTLNN